MRGLLGEHAWPDLPLTKSPEPPIAAILRRHSRPDWQHQAACVGLAHPDTWFPEPSAIDRVRVAKAFCARCPVNAACFVVALVDHEHGIWGGTTDAERDDARADLAAGVPAEQVLSRYLIAESQVEWKQTA